MAANSPPAHAERTDFYRRLDAEGLAPLWEVLGSLVPREPAPTCRPASWKYDTVRPLLMEAGRLITAREAERRVLVFENPARRGSSAVTQTLYAGMQLILPGEVAPSHRHTQSALRFVVEGSGAYTAVDGERASMSPGDFIVTPSWTFHDHGNPGDSPVVWLDGLDIPLVSFFDAGFSERYPEESQPVTKEPGDAQARFGAGLLPLEYAPRSAATPLLAYPYARTRSALTQLSRSGPPDPRHGFKLQYANPVNGGPPMPTIGAFIQLLPRGFRGAGHRSTDGTVFSVVEGRGRTRAGELLIEWGPKDLFVVPSWCAVAHEADEDAVLFSFSDRPAQKFFGIWREEALA
jgi:gentisate 1,2-dioxygenase